MRRRHSNSHSQSLAVLLVLLVSVGDLMRRREPAEMVRMVKVGKSQE
jgi:hypothetical protein